MSENQIESLIKAANNLVSAANTSNERMAILETNSANMQKAIAKLADGQTSMLKSMEELARSSIKVEQDMLRLEEKALDKIKDIQVRHERLETEVGTLTGKMHLFEIENIATSLLPAKVDKLISEVEQLKLINATASGREQGKEGFKSFLVGNWFNLIKVVFMLSAIISGILFFYKQGGNPWLKGYCLILLSSVYLHY